MSNLQQLVDNLSSLTVMEAAELSKLLEEKWGVSAAAPVAHMPVASSSTAEAVVEKTDFDVVLIDIGANKLNIIKEVRVIDSKLSLTEAKTLVESAPKAIKSGVSKDEAQKIKTALEAAGAKVEIK